MDNFVLKMWYFSPIDFCRVHFWTTFWPLFCLSWKGAAPLEVMKRRSLKTFARRVLAFHLAQQLQMSPLERQTRTVKFWHVNACSTATPSMHMPQQSPSNLTAILEPCDSHLHAYPTGGVVMSKYMNSNWLDCDGGVYLSMLVHHRCIVKPQCEWNMKRTPIHDRCRRQLRVHSNVNHFRWRMSFICTRTITGIAFLPTTRNLNRVFRL